MPSASGLEKDALSGVLYPITSEYDVALMPSRGYSSVTFVHEAAETLLADRRPAFIYHLGDFDPSGVDAARAIEQELREHAPGVDITFERLAVLPQQIGWWRLPSRATKQSNSRAKNFRDTSVELDAIDPNRLRRLVESALEKHMPRTQLDNLRSAEESERADMLAITETAKGRFRR